MPTAATSTPPPAAAAVPSETWRQLAIGAAEAPAPPRGLDAVWNTAAGGAAALMRRPTHYLAEADAVGRFTDTVRALADDALHAEAEELRITFRLGRETRADVLRAFALLREGALRTLGLFPHPVQVAAGLIIHDGRIAEMATGEGKTLAASIPTIIAGWRGRGCHVVTFNGYLAGRDAETMAPFYNAFGVTCAALDDDMEPDERRRAYACDITYCTSKDIAADFLRDRLSLGQHTRLVAAMLAQLIQGSDAGVGGLLMRGLDTAIIDEADTILIDEAVTPLIISGEAPNAEQVAAYEAAAAIARELEPDVHYRVNHRYREVTLTRAGDAAVEAHARALGGIWRARRRREECILQALNARALFLRDEQYVVDEGKVVIVDESTGRLMPDRMWRAGLHQAVEAKEGLEVNAPKDTLARLSFQRFFRMYRHLGGTTGTAWEAREELWQTYGLQTTVVPTHRPCRRIQHPERVFTNHERKWAGVLEEIKRVHATGRPILVGTASVEASEDLSERLTAAGLEHQVLNAVRHREEAEIVAGAGARGCITVATNMAGRGTDIKLSPEVKELGGLHVIATERAETSRIDRQLFGRSARQGDPGSAVMYSSLDDRLCRGYAAPALRRLARSHPQRLGLRVINRAQSRAVRAAVQQRHGVLATDDWLDEFLGFAGREL